MAEARNEARNEVRKEYIEREALVRAIENSLQNNPHSSPQVRQIHRHEHRHFLVLVDQQPSADVVEVRRGEWIRDEQSYFYHRYNCSACGYRHLGEPTKFCGECGADMRGNNNDNRTEN